MKEAFQIISRLCLCLCALYASLLSFGTSARAQSITQQQLASLAPDEQDLQGFVRVLPVGELPTKTIFQNGQWIQQQSPSAPVEDDMHLNMDVAKRVYGWAELSGETGQASHLIRNLYSSNGVYHVEIHLSLCDSSATAKNELTSIRGGSSGDFEPGSFTSAATIGDESWFLRGHNFKYLIFCSGNLVVDISGSPSDSALRSGVTATFPPAAVEAVAYQILLRASREAKLTGVPTLDAHVAVNGKPLSDKALTVDRQTYVPVAAFAEAMGMQSRWNNKTGALTLSGANHKPISLTAGSTAATEGAKAVALKTPVLKENGQPVMTLSDLLTLVNGRVTRKGDTLQVKA